MYVILHFIYPSIIGLFFSHFRMPSIQKSPSHRIHWLWLVVSFFYLQELFYYFVVQLSSTVVFFYLRSVWLHIPRFIYLQKVENLFFSVFIRHIVSVAYKTNCGIFLTFYLFYFSHKSCIS